MRKLSSTSELSRFRESVLARRDPEKSCITVCCGTGCSASAAVPVYEAFQEEVIKRGLQAKVDTKSTGCHGFCERGPLTVISPQKIFYQRVTVEDVPEIVEKTLLGGEIIERLLYVDPVTEEKIIKEEDVPFYKGQQRLLMGKNGLIDPRNIRDYIALDGYAALPKVLSNSGPEHVIEEITRAGLRGRGGAGFMTGKKWEICRAQKREPKYVVCNADEGDPGAFMDRSLLEGNPHSVIEGMTIGAYAIGASEGFIYVRTEYPLALKHLIMALRQARELGLLGENILGTGFSFDINLVRGAGAFVCGEETALIKSIEGMMGEPTQRPPYPVERGIDGLPTNINNVKTWASVPMIMNNGADWFAGIGTEKSKGTMIFSLVGKINNTGLVEVPMGITLRELIYEIGGGIPGDKQFKAVQTGGPSGGCIPAELLDLPVDYERLTKAGSMMGSGGMVVMDEDTCMVDVAKYFMNFLKEESCGKCFTCRKGTQRMYEILEDISDGKGTREDLALLEELALVVKDTTMCGLGQTASNPVLSTLRYFRDEYVEHIEKKQCSAGVCKSLITYSINDNCTGCMVCLKACPEKAITGKKKELHVIDEDKCIKCGACRSVCKFDAIDVR